MTDQDSTDKPDWWRRNQADRAALGLPEYDPPKFEDNVYVHKLIEDIEREHDCSLQILGVGTDYLDEWEVRLDGETLFKIPRYRNENGNTVYRMSSEEFREGVINQLV